MSKIIRFARIQKEPMIITNNYIFEEEEEEEVYEAKEELIDSSLMDELLASAKNEAINIVAEAKGTSEQLLNEAYQQVDQIKQQAYEEGNQKGYQEGVTQGRQAGLDEMQHAICEAIEKAQHTLNTAGIEAKEMILAAERQIVEIALAVANKILVTEIEENPLVVLPVVRAALEKVRDQEQIVIRVSVGDFNAVLQAKPDLQIMIGREHDLKIIADSTIQGGSCVIDTSYGVVDARVDTQFDSLKKALQGVLP